VSALEIVLEKGARFVLTELFVSEAFAEVTVKQAARSLCHITAVQLSSANASYTVDLDGPGAESLLGGAFLAAGQEHCVVRLRTNHNVPDCRSNSYIKGVAGGTAVGEFCGLVYVAPDAQRTDAQQQNRNILLSETAHIATQPQLEIYADDVKCSHGSTVGQLNEQALFYMQQRGISREEAQMLLKFAFAGEVIDAISLEALRDRLHHLVEKRFRGELSRCSGCKLCK